MAGSPSSPKPVVKALNCPNCGAALQIRAGDHTINVVCVQCLSILDAKDPNLQVLQQFQARERVQAIIPLGARGKWRGDPYQVIGFQVRAIEVEGVPYSWQEYLLFNPYKGFRYLTYYNGHWNDVTTVRAVPDPGFSGGKKAQKLLGKTYVHFQSATAQTIYVMGEFPWQIRVGETARVSDYICPPQMLSSETTESETTWSLGEYTPGAVIWQAFKLPGGPPPAIGVFANQPSPYQGKVAEIWFYFLAMLIVLTAMALGFYSLESQQEVFKQQYTFAPRSRGENSFVTPAFELGGRTSAVELSIRTNLRDDWAYFNLALINEATGQAYDFGREISNDPHELTDSPNDSVLIPTVPPGRYYLRVEPEVSPGRVQPMSYEIQIRRDVPSAAFFVIAFLLLLTPPVLRSIQAAGFEKTRWSESDYGPGLTIGKVVDGVADAMDEGDS